MKYLMTIALFVLACSNPATVSEITEYSTRYEITAVDDIWFDGYFYNPETLLSEHTHGVGEWFCTAEMIAHSGQTLWVELTCSETLQAFISVDGEIIAESAIADSVYVEYTLP